MLNWIRKRMKRNQRGFTLIELIVVIAILGVLAAIAVPNVMGSLARSKMDADKATAVTIANAALECFVRDPSSSLTGVIDNNHKLIKDNYLNKVPIPQDQTNNHAHFYLEVTPQTNKNPTIEVYYANDNGNKIDSPILYPQQ